MCLYSAEFLVLKGFRAIIRVEVHFLEEFLILSSLMSLFFTPYKLLGGHLKSKGGIVEFCSCIESVIFFKNFIVKPN